jgi:hypothetical protein
MAKIVIPPPAKLFIGILVEDDATKNKVLPLLNEKYGEIDQSVENISFINTEYYNEIGTNLKKSLFSFKKLISRDTLGDCKIFTNLVENQYSKNDVRTINIDPGYLTLSNVFLASCKDFFHRSYIGNGIFIENEYYFQNGSFQFWNWTYPDYKKNEYLDFFHSIRKIYHVQLRSQKLI